MCEGHIGSKELTYYCTGYVCLRGSMRVRSRKVIVKDMYVLEGLGIETIHRQDNSSTRFLETIHRHN